MNDNEIIKEMVKDYKLCYPCEMFIGYVDEEGKLSNYTSSCFCLEGINPIQCSICKDTAKVLICAGYRKESDTAREILQEAKVHFGEMNGDRETFENWLCKRYGADLGDGD